MSIIARFTALLRRGIHLRNTMKLNPGVSTLYSFYILRARILKLRYVVGFGLVKMAISTNPNPTIHSNLYENWPLHISVLTQFQILA